jgi:hypothetical protein
MLWSNSEIYRRGVNKREAEQTTRRFEQALRRLPDGSTEDRAIVSATVMGDGSLAKR